MALEFTEKDDPRGAYIAGSSGSQTYTPSSGEISQAEKDAFTAGFQSTQQGVPQVFQDEVQQSGSNLQVTKNPLREQLENLQNQDQAIDFINTLNQADTGGTSGMGILQPDVLGYIKDPLAAIGAFTTDPTENRNVYQLLINKMFQGNQPQMSGAMPLRLEDVQGLNRIGRTLFSDPNKTSFFGDVKGLFTNNNPAVIDILTDTVGGGITELPEFGQAGLDFAKEQGFKDYGQIIQNLITGATPLKYGKFLFDKTKEKLGGTDDNDEDEISKLIDSISDDDGSFEVAELTDKQKDFIKKQSFAIKEGLKTPSSVFETINNPNLGIFKKPFFGIGGQDPTTVEEFNEYLKSLDQTMPTIIT
tara:strand:- start:411 stop:1490 length:1080 start_codon:yes stop_codon:yes gene_type:complete